MDEKEDETRIAIFNGKKMRRKLVDNKWLFSVVDVIEVLTGSPTPRQYWSKVKDREFERLQLSPIWVRLKLIAEDGKLRETDCADTESIFRIIQSIPSKKAEPFKRWLARVGYERVQEIENPELAQDRMKKLYEEKGYPKSWIEKRVRGIAIRQGLTDEWKNRGVEENKDFAILTNEIAKATFGVGIKEHKELKGLEPKFKNQNLRDHMTDLELIFGMLGEASTTEIARETDTQGFSENKIAAKKGGKIAGDARKKLEIESGKGVVSEDNYLDIKKKNIQIKINKKRKEDI